MVIINGEPKDAAGKTVMELLASMKLLPERTAVVVEGEILPKSGYDRILADGETVEIIGFVGGG